MLSLIESEYKGGNRLLSLEGIQKNEETENLAMPQVKGKNHTTTFRGFCGYHDDKLFNKIENNNDYQNTIEHNFLHSYRSFVYSYHFMMKLNKAIENNGNNSTRQEGRIKINQNLLRSFVNQIQIIESQRIKLNKAIEYGDLSIFNFYVYEFDEKIPVGCCGIVHPQYDYYNKKLDPEFVSANLILTCFPEKNKFICICAGFKDDIVTTKLLDHIKNLNQLHRQKMITALMMNYTNSTVISLKIWDKLETKGRVKFSQYLKRYKADQYNNPRLKQGFNKSFFNIYSKKYR